MMRTCTRSFIRTDSVTAEDTYRSQLNTCRPTHLENVEEFVVKAEVAAWSKVKKAQTLRTGISFSRVSICMNDSYIVRACVTRDVPVVVSLILLYISHLFKAL